VFSDTTQSNNKKPVDSTVRIDEYHESPSPSYFRFSISPNIGVAFTSESHEYSDDMAVDWNSQLQATFNYEPEDYHFNVDIFMQYGQFHQNGALPVKTRDDLILTLMPSVKLFNRPSIRLFFQIKGETDMTKGMIDSNKTDFLDPLYLTNTIFLGEKQYFIPVTTTNSFNMTYGFGYSFIKVFNKEFKIINTDYLSNDPNYVGGVCALLNLEYFQTLFADMTFNFDFKSMAVAKNNEHLSLNNFRYTSLLTSSLQYNFISIMYTNRLVFDSDISKRRRMDQSLTLGVKFTIN